MNFFEDVAQPPEAMLLPFLAFLFVDYDPIPVTAKKLQVYQVLHSPPYLRHKTCGLNIILTPNNPNPCY